MEQEVGQAPAVPVLKDPVAISVSLLLFCFYLIILLPAILSFMGMGAVGKE